MVTKSREKGMNKLKVDAKARISSNLWSYSLVILCQ